MSLPERKPVASERDAPARDETPSRRVPAALLAALAALCAALVLTSVPGGFTVDEANSLVSVVQLRKMDFSAPGTAGLTPSPEFLFFDPAARVRVDRLDHMGSTAPPLYALLALPFLPFGLRGFIALNALAFCAAAVCVYWLAARRATSRATPWIAVVAYVAGSYTIEYAQGIWPHALSASLATIGFCLAVRARDGGAGWAVLAGVAFGFAAGVRYQNVVFAAAVGFGLLLFSKRRATTSLAFGAAFCLPLLACSLFNHARLGSWNPISKGPGYLAIARERRAPEIAAEAARVLWAKVVDYSAHPIPDDPVAEITTWWRRDPRTGATIFLGALKKAWLQSSPWLVLPLLAMAASWTRRPGSPRDEDLRMASLVVAATLASFAATGFARHDGVCFNQRYFLELMPVAAVAGGWFLEARRPTTASLALGAAAGAILASRYLAIPDLEAPGRQLLGLRAPLVIAAALLASSLTAAFVPAARRAASAALVALFAMGVAYGGVIHLGEDVAASRARRTAKRDYVRLTAGVLPPGKIALLVRKSAADMYAPLLLDRDVAILDTWVDEGASAPRLVRELHGAGRRVFLVPSLMSQAFVESLLREFPARLALNDPRMQVLELGRPPAPGAPPGTGIPR
jgi:hypothetical protein